MGNKFPVSRDVVDAVAALLLERVGFDVGDRLYSRLESAIETMGAELGTDVQGVIRKLRSVGIDHPAWHMLLGRVTVGETYFFRDARQFEALRSVILPALLHEHREDHTLLVWSAGCASGEEPYSIAIVLRELIENPEAWNVKIIGTDINPEALQRAREGLYRKWSFRRTSSELLERYFEQEGDLWRLSGDVRRMVFFTQLNLVDRIPPGDLDGFGEFDLVLCRNVLMYMPPDVRARAASRLASAIRPGGRLMLAAVELDRALFPQLVQEREGGVVVYRRPLDHEKNMRESRERHDATVVRTLRRAAAPTRSGRRSPLARDGVGRSIETAPARSSRTTSGTPERRVSVLRPSPGLLKTADELAVEARRAADAARPNEAAAKAGQALALDPLCGGAYHVLGLLALERGDLEGATQALRRALYVDPRLVPAHLALAAVAVRRGRPEAAHRHRLLAMELLREMPQDVEVPGEPGMTAGALLTSLGAGDESGAPRQGRMP